MADHVTVESITRSRAPRLSRRACLKRLGGGLGLASLALLVVYGLTVRPADLAG